MHTIAQYAQYRVKRRCKNRTPALQFCPQKKGICIKPFIRTPKKPNSAKRRVAKLRLSNKKIVVAYIPGISHNLKEYGSVLMRGGRERDLPAVKYHLIRGKYDLYPVLERILSRSKYGTPKPKY